MKFWYCNIFDFLQDQFFCSAGMMLKQDILDNRIMSIVCKLNQPVFPFTLKYKTGNSQWHYPYNCFIFWHYNQILPALPLFICFPYHSPPSSLYELFLTSPWKISRGHEKVKYRLQMARNVIIYRSCSQSTHGQGVFFSVWLGVSWVQ